MADVVHWRRSVITSLVHVVAWPDNRVLAVFAFHREYLGFFRGSSQFLLRTCRFQSHSLTRYHKYSIIRFDSIFRRFRIYDYSWLLMLIFGLHPHLQYFPVFRGIQRFIVGKRAFSRKLIDFRRGSRRRGDCGIASPLGRKKGGEKKNDKDKRMKRRENGRHTECHFEA